MADENRIYVLDSSAFINADDVPDGELFSTPKIREEVRDFKSRMLFQTRSIKTIVPGSRYVAEVKSKAVDTGDFTKLSSADISVLALALQLKETKKKAIILTDDYNIQNMAEEMGMDYKPVSVPGIKKIFKRMLYCGKCRKYRAGDKCPGCGGPLRLRVVR